MSDRTGEYVPAPIGFERRGSGRKLFCRTCGGSGWPGGRWMEGHRFGHGPCPRCGGITTLLPDGRQRTHGTCPKALTGSSTSAALIKENGR